MKRTISFSLILITGCNQMFDRTNEPIIVPDIKTLNTKTEMKNAIRYPYYLPMNLIIDRNEHVYFYQQNVIDMFCTTGITCDTPPDFINLQPKDLMEIPIENIVQFLQQNVKYLENANRTIAISSTSDTIIAPEIKKIFTFMNDQTNNIRYTFRHTTQEEKIVLSFKKSGEVYFPDKINWDSTKIQFAPKILPTLKFRPPG